MRALGWLVLSGVLFALGEGWSRRLVDRFSWLIVMEATGLYTLGVWAWFPAILEKRSLSLAGTLWSTISLIMTVVVGVVWFKEELTPRLCIGVLLALASVLVLEM